MKPIWIEDPNYSIARYYVDFCARTSFISLKVEGRENLPNDGVVILAPNHRAALMDPLLVLQLRHKPIGFGARADIFRNRKVAAILNWLRIVPIARERDGLKEVSANFAVFDEIVECLAHQTPFCLFSEGTHRAERGMMPVKKGIFRIARMAMEKIGKPVYIVPIGLEYEYFQRQMGRAAVRVGKPIELGAFIDAHIDEGEAHTNQLLCAELRSRILALTDQLPERNKDFLLPRIVLGALCLPLFASCALAALPIWLPSYLILRNMEDKAWAHTVNFAVRFLLPLLWPAWWIFCLLLNLYRNIREDLGIE